MIKYGLWFLILGGGVSELHMASLWSAGTRRFTTNTDSLDNKDWRRVEHICGDMWWVMVPWDQMINIDWGAIFYWGVGAAYWSGVHGALFQGTTKYQHWLKTLIEIHPYFHYLRWIYYYYCNCHHVSPHHDRLHCLCSGWWIAAPLSPLPTSSPRVQSLHCHSNSTTCVPGHATIAMLSKYLLILMHCCLLRFFPLFAVDCLANTLQHLPPIPPKSANIRPLRSLVPRVPALSIGRRGW